MVAQPPSISNGNSRLAALLINIAQFLAFLLRDIQGHQLPVVALVAVR